MKNAKRLLAILLSVVLLLGVAPMSMVSAATVVPRAVRLQWTNEWTNVYYGTTYRGSLYDTGCGIFSTVNAVGYLTGNEMSVTEVADWAYEIKALNYYAGGVDRTIMYPKLEEKFGKEYGFTVGDALWAKATTPSLLTHLQNGGAAIAHVYGHFIAIVGYDASSGYFHVYDSAPSSARGTGNGDAWVSTSWITTSTYFTVDWFVPITRTGTVINRDYGETGGTTADKIGTYKITTENLNVRAGASTSYDVVTTVAAGDLVDVSEFSGVWGKLTTADGKVGWANVTNYASYVGVDALAYENAANTSGITAAYDAKGRVTLTNTSASTGQYDFFLPVSLGSVTTPYMSVQIAPLYGNGYYFGVTQKGSAYWMMRDCSSANELVNATSAPFMTNLESLEINLANWWKPSTDLRVNHVRVYVAPYSAVRVNYLYFTPEAKMVTDSSYNLNTVDTNINLMRPDGLDIADRTKTGGYSYKNGILTVTSNDDNGYAVVFDVNQSFNVYNFLYWIMSFDADVAFNMSMLVTHTGGESWVSMASDYFDQFGIDYPASGFLPARSGSCALGLYGFYSYNGVLPTDGISTVKQVKIALGGKGRIVVDAVQLSETDCMIAFTDSVSKSDSSTATQKVVFESSVYNVTNEFVTNIAAQTTLEAFLGGVRSDYTVTLFEKGVAVTNSSVLKTGQILTVSDGTTTLVSCEVVVHGDVNGDGKATTTDGRAMLASLVSTSLEGAQKLAADINGSGEIDSTDIRLLMNTLVG